MRRVAGSVQLTAARPCRWKTSIAKCKTYDDLPAAAQKYIQRIEALVGVPVSWIGTGPAREEMLEKSWNN